MNKIIYLQLARRSVPTCFDIVQCATTPSIEFILEDYTPGTGSSARIYIKKSETEVFNDCVIDGNKIIYNPTAKSFDEPGHMVAQLQILDGGKVAVSFRLFVTVEPNIIEDGAIEASDEYGALVTLMQDVEDFNNRFDIINKRLSSLVTTTTRVYELEDTIPASKWNNESGKYLTSGRVEVNFEGENFKDFEIAEARLKVGGSDYTTTDEIFYTPMISDNKGYIYYIAHTQAEEVKTKGGTIEFVVTLPAADTSVSPEVADARIGHDGTVYDSLGDAVRGQAFTGIPDGSVGYDSLNDDLKADLYVNPGDDGEEGNTPISVTSNNGYDGANTYAHPLLMGQAQKNINKIIVYYGSTAGYLTDIARIEYTHNSVNTKPNDNPEILPDNSYSIISTTRETTGLKIYKTGIEININIPEGEYFDLDIVHRTPITDVRYRQNAHIGSEQVSSTPIKVATGQVSTSDRWLVFDTYIVDYTEYIASWSSRISPVEQVQDLRSEMEECCNEVKENIEGLSTEVKEGIAELKEEFEEKFPISYKELDDDLYYSIYRGKLEETSLTVTYKGINEKWSNSEAIIPVQGGTALKQIKGFTIGKPVAQTNSQNENAYIVLRTATERETITADELTVYAYLRAPGETTFTKSEIPSRKCNVTGVAFETGSAQPPGSTLINVKLAYFSLDVEIDIPKGFEYYLEIDYSRVGETIQNYYGASCPCPYRDTGATISDFDTVATKAAIYKGISATMDYGAVLSGLTGTVGVPYKTIYMDGDRKSAIELIENLEECCDEVKEVIDDLSPVTPNALSDDLFHAIYEGSLPLEKTYKSKTEVFPNRSGGGRYYTSTTTVTSLFGTKVSFIAMRILNPDNLKKISFWWYTNTDSNAGKTVYLYGQNGSSFAGNATEIAESVIITEQYSTTLYVNKVTFEADFSYNYMVVAANTSQQINYMAVNTGSPTDFNVDDENEQIIIIMVMNGWGPIDDPEHPTKIVPGSSNGVGAQIEVTRKNAISAIELIAELESRVKALEEKA